MERGAGGGEGVTKRWPLRVASNFSTWVKYGEPGGGGIIKTAYHDKPRCDDVQVFV